MKRFFFLTLIFVMTAIIGCARKEEQKKIILPPKIPIEEPEVYVPERYEYKSFKMRDPFVPLIVSETEEMGKKSEKKGEIIDIPQIDIANLELTGIIWDKKEAMAVFHDGNNCGYILKRGRLLADNFEPIKGITGKIIGNNRVFLQQGKTKVDLYIGKPNIIKRESELLAQVELEEERK